MLRAIARRDSAENISIRRLRSTCAPTTMLQHTPTIARPKQHSSPSLNALAPATPTCVRDPFESLRTYVDAFVTPSQKQATFSRLRSTPLSSSKIEATSEIAVTPIEKLPHERRAAHLSPRPLRPRVHTDSLHARRSQLPAPRLSDWPKLVAEPAERIR
jgi:hypothetical protein